MPSMQGSLIKRESRFVRCSAVARILGKNPLRLPLPPRNKGVEDLAKSAALDIHPNVSLACCLSVQYRRVRGSLLVLPTQQSHTFSAGSD